MDGEEASVCDRVFQTVAYISCIIFHMYTHIYIYIPYAYTCMYSVCMGVLFRIINRQDLL